MVSTIPVLVAAAVLGRSLAAVAPDTAAIAAVRSAFVAAVRAKDAPALSRLTTSGVVMIRGEPGRFPVVGGRTRFEEFWRDSFGRMSGPNPYSLQPGEVSVTPSSAAEVGEFGPTGEPPIGRYVLIYLLEEGEWRVSYWNFFRKT
jgi:ketosteroid isomerase-like protein